MNAIKTRIDSLFDHQNQGVRIACVRFLQKLVQVQSGGNPINDQVSLDLIPLDHPFLIPAQLSAECTAVLNRFVAFLSNTHLFLAFNLASTVPLHLSLPCLTALMKY